MKKYSFLVLLLAIFSLFLAGSLSAATCAPGKVSVEEYCNLAGDILPAKQEGSSCLNDYECLNSACTENICETKYQEVREHTNFLNLFLDQFLGFFNTKEGKNLDAPILSFEDPTTPDSWAIGSTVAQDYIEASISAFDINDSVESITILLYDSGWNLVNSTTAFSDSHNILFNDLAYGLYYLNATANDTFGNEGQIKNRIIALDSREISLYPSLELVPPLNQIYYPDSDINFKVNITAYFGIRKWTINSDVLGYIKEGVDEGVNLNIKFNLSKLSSANIETQEISFIVEDVLGFTLTEKFDVSMKSENCTDGKDNDGDIIFDGLDLDCADEGVPTPISLVEVFSPSEAYADRKINVNCQYSTDSTQSPDVIGRICIKLGINEIACPLNEIVGDFAKFKDCRIGSEEALEAEVICYVENCLVTGTPEKKNGIDITEFDICKYGVIGEENLTVILTSSHRVDSETDRTIFDSGDELVLDINALHVLDAEVGVSVGAEIYHFNDAGNKGTLIASSDKQTLILSQAEEGEFAINLSIPLDIEAGDNFGLYYKVYLDEDEDYVCVGGDILLTLRGDDCIDDDDDGYCEETSDCDDDDENINPGAEEICTDNIDNDCDFLTDERDSDCILLPGQVLEIEAGGTDDAGALTTQGVRRLMHPTSSMSFQLGTETHTAVINTITDNAVTITISSDSFDVSLTIGQTKDVDTDGDGIEDLRITLNGIIGEKADITFRNIYTSTSTPQPREPIRPTKPADESGSGKGVLIFMVVLVLVIGVVVALVYLKKKRKSGVGFARGPSPSGPGPPAPRRPAPPVRPPTPAYSGGQRRMR